MMKEKLKQIYRMTNPYFKYIEKPVEKGVILYESFFGQSMSCGPYAIFRKLIECKEKYGNFHHVWSVADVESAKKILADLKFEADVELVKYKSAAYSRYLATAEYVINNVTFPQYYRKRQGQTYINTWHGIPLKSMGYDTPDGIIDSANTVRNFLQADYLLSPNSHHTQMYNESYKLKNIYNGIILEEGQARCDRLYDAEREDVICRLTGNGVNIDRNRKIIMYAPTWRGTKWDNPSASINDYISLYDYLSEHIDTEKYQILIKPHIAVYRKWAMHDKLPDYIVSSAVDTNEILSVTDILISDYSSIFYDYIVTNRPVLFYCDDMEEYKRYRGIDDITKRLPAPITSSREQLAAFINNIEEVYDEYREQYQKIRSWAAPKDDGHATERILDIVMKKGANTGKETVQNHAEKTSKEKILFFLGSLRPYGITYSMLSLLQNMDYDRYDVTLYVYKPLNKPDMERLYSIPKQVRVLVHTVASVGSVLDNMHFVMGMQEGYQNSKKYLPYIASNEFVRMFGQSKFDYVIDFVGYSPLFSMVAANAPSGVKSIWQHNDMLADQNKVVNGKKPNKKRLEIVFGTYPEFDHVIACSKSVMELNQKQIGGNDSYRFVSNMIDIKRIEGCFRQDSDFKTLSDVVGEDTASMLCEPGYVNFVNMARLSEEKNQFELIKAFELFSKKYKNSRLYIMGDGICNGRYSSYIKDRGLSDRIILTGNVSNPFAVMKRCGCFILPSLHEGHPMVILEARTMNMPIIMTEFSTSKDCMMNNGQLICKADSISINHALEAFMNGDVPSYEFDAAAYNDMALKEFEYAIR